MIKNQKGWIKPLLCILLLIVSVYVGLKFLIPYYHHNALKSEAKAIARLAYNNPDRYRDMLYEKALSLNVPIKRSDIYASIQNNHVRISTSWKEVVDLLGYYRIPLSFEIDVEE